MKLRSSPRACHFQKPLGGSPASLALSHSKPGISCGSTPSSRGSGSLHPSKTLLHFLSCTNILALKQFTWKTRGFFSALGHRHARLYEFQRPLTLSGWSFLMWKRRDGTGDIQPFETTKQKLAQSSVF